MAQTLDLTAADGHRLQAYLAQPAGAPRGGLVVCQEIFGINAHMRAVTDGYARAGYLAVAPALFDRAERGVELDYNEEGMTAGRELRAAITWDQVVADVAAAHGAVSEAGKTGVVGYCWGGSIAWLAACRLGVNAAVGYYGGQIYDHRTEQPGCPVMLHFGERDAMIPAEQVEAVRALHPEIPIHLYPAGHGFNCDARADYDEASAGLAAERTQDFLKENLD